MAPDAFKNSYDAIMVAWHKSINRSGIRKPGNPPGFRKMRPTLRILVT